MFVSIESRWFTAGPVTIAYIVKSLRGLLKCGGALPELTVQTAWAGNDNLKQHSADTM